MRKGATILDVVTEGNRKQLVSLLNRDPGLLEYRTLQGRTILWIASSYGKAKMVKVILDYKARNLEEGPSTLNS